jgi:hypothetical protein
MKIPDMSRDDWANLVFTGNFQKPRVRKTLKMVLRQGIKPI